MPPNNSFFSQPSAPSGAPTPVPPQAPVGVTPQPVAPAPQPAATGSGTAQTTRQAPKNPNSTQNTLQLSEVRDNMVVMIDGSFRAVISCKSINFDLMSDKEREGVEFSYQNFLNSLNFPIQILVRSQRVDIGPYIEKMLDLRRSQDNMLLGVLMDDYINFIDALSQDANIMEKSFYIVVPYFPQGDAANLIEQGKGFFGKLFARPKNTVTRIDTAAYQKAKEEIKNRVDSVMAGLFQIGVQSAQLDTKSLGELYYNFYNPDTAVRQPLGNFESSTGIYTKKATEAPTPGGAQ
jgi:type IV secretory pathway VirB4 component